MNLYEDAVRPAASGRRDLDQPCQSGQRAGAQEPERVAVPRLGPLHPPGFRTDPKPKPAAQAVDQEHLRLRGQAFGKRSPSVQRRSAVTTRP